MLSKIFKLVLLAFNIRHILGRNRVSLLFFFNVDLVELHIGGFNIILVALWFVRCLKLFTKKRLPVHVGEPGVVYYLVGFVSTGTKAFARVPIE